jgi:predicted transcriptional regulator
MSKPTRDRIRALVMQYPGLHLREIARQLDMSLALVQYHLPELVAAGQAKIVDEDGTQRVFPRDDQSDPRQVAALRDGHRLHFALLMLDRGAMAHRELCGATGLGKSTVSFHLKRLIKAELVGRDGANYILANREATRALLESHKPTPDVVDRFATMWADLYG